LLQVLLPNLPLLILDEPTNTLDPTMRDELLAQLSAARARGQAVLFSSHVLAEVEQICDRVGILHKGRLVHAQTVADLREVKRVRVSFADSNDALPELHGMRAPMRLKNEWTFEYAGPLPDLFGWLAQQAVLDVKIEPLGLAGIYQKYHGSEA